MQRILVSCLYTVIAPWKTARWPEWKSMTAGVMQEMQIHGECEASTERIYDEIWPFIFDDFLKAV